MNRIEDDYIGIYTEPTFLFPTEAEKNALTK